MKTKRLLSLFLALALTLAILPFGMFNVSAEWTIRDSLPTSSDPAWTYYSAPINNYPLSPYNGGNCTWYAYGRAYEVHGFDSGCGAAGNAQYWYWMAYHNLPWKVDQNPAPGAIVCWDGTYGHVGFVERVNSDGTVTWSQSSYAESGQNYKAFEIVTGNPATYSKSSLTFQGYIHVGTPKTPVTPITYTTISNGTYYIKNNSNGEYVSVSYGEDAQGQNVNTWEFDPETYEQMVFTKTSGDGYKIRPALCDSRLINAYGTTVSSGNNVNIWDDVNESSQWWGLEAVSGGYVIRNMMNPSCVLTLTTTSTSNKEIIVSTYTGETNQIWTIQNYITYDANGGTGAPSGQLVNYDKTLTLSSTKPTRSGYTFLGWSTSSSATSPSYYAGGSFTSNSNTTLYAVWSKNTYTVSYNGQGGGNVPASQTQYCDEPLILSSTVPYCNGYTFLGWSKDPSSTANLYAPGSYFYDNANTTLYAMWIEDYCTVSYNANGGTGAPYSESILKSYTTTVKSAVPERSGYTFLGWSTSSTGSVEYVGGNSITVWDNITLYAVWAKSDGLIYTLSSDGTYYIISGYDGTESAVVVPSTYKGLPVKEIGGYAFSYIENLTSIKISDSITTIGDFAFSCNKILESVIIGDSVITIGDYAFHYCENLESVIMGDSVTTIGEYAFWFCGNLTSIVIPNSVTTIGKEAFSCCESLSNVQISKSVTTIGYDAFVGCSSLKTMVVDSENNTYHISGNCLIETSTKTLIKGFDSSIIPDDGTVTTIGKSAFLGCDGLKSIKIPNFVTTIGAGAFHSCDNLKNIEISNSVTTIESEAFSWNTNLISIKIPDSVRTIGTYAFSSCDSLSSIVIPKSVITIGEEAFSWCDNLNDIYCKAESKPEGWNDEWLQYCNATVYWGYNPVKITTQPKTVSVQSGKTAKVTVAATGEGLKYQWYFKNKGDSKFTLTNSYKSNTYSLEMNGTRAGRQVYCVITDKYGNEVKTNTVTLGMAVKITKQPTTVSVQSGKQAKVTVSASGEGKTYKWYYKDKNATKFTLTNSFKGDSYYIEMNGTRAGRQVYCVIADKYGNSVKTKTVTLGMAVKITKQPATVAVQNGKTAKVSVTVSGEGRTYKWYFKDKGASKFTLTNSFKGASYSITMTNARAGRQVYCVITDKYGNSEKTKTVTLGMAVKITKQPTSVKVYNGKTAKVSVSATGEGRTYKWYFKDKGSSKFYLTTSFTGSTYSVTMTNARAGRQVYCIITDKYGNSVKTNTVTLNKR